MSTEEAAEISEEDAAIEGVFNEEQEKSSGGIYVLKRSADALNKSLDISKKLIDQGHSLAKQGPVYAMVFLSVALVAFAISFAEFHSSDSADFIASLVIASVLLIVSGILRLINNVSESRGAAQQVSELGAHNERVVKYLTEQNAIILARRQEELPLSSPHT